MAAPVGPDGGRGQRPAARRGAAAAAGTPDPNRKRRRAALIMLAALIVVAGVAGIVVAATRSHHAASAAPHPAAATGAASASAQSTVSASASAQASPAGTTAALPAFGLVGGGGVTPRTADGKLAVAGSVGDVLFAEAGTGLDHNARTVVDSAAQAIRQHHPATVTVIGYTDAIGNARANHRLSLERARAVISALRAQVGSIAVTYRPEARGQGKPVASNSTAAGRQLNRRVVITTS